MVNGLFFINEPYKIYAFVIMFSSSMPNPSMSHMLVNVLKNLTLCVAQLINHFNSSDHCGHITTLLPVDFLKTSIIET
jgi:hypothetical protein